MGNSTDAIYTDYAYQVDDLKKLGFKVISHGTNDYDPDLPTVTSLAVSTNLLSPKTYLTGIKNLSGNRSLHGIFVDGHGRPGHMWTAEKAFKVSYNDISKTLKYRLGAVILNVCNGGWCAADKPQEGGLYDNGIINGEAYGPPQTQGGPGDPPTIKAGGADLVSSSPEHVFYGLKRGLDPTGLDSFPDRPAGWDTDNARIKDLFSNNKQGTN